MKICGVFYSPLHSTSFPFNIMYSPTSSRNQSLHLGQFLKANSSSGKATVLGSLAKDGWEEAGEILPRWEAIEYR